MSGTSDPFVVARFWSKVQVKRPSECWHWTGYVNPDGYGQFWDGTRLVRAHRFAATCVGKNLDEAVGDHTCHNGSGCTDVPCDHRRCCNPRHIEATTQAVNSRRGRSGAHQSEKTHCRNGHPYSVENTILRDSGTQRVCRTCNRLAQQKYNSKRKTTDD